MRITWRKILKQKMGNAYRGENNMLNLEMDTELKKAIITLMQHEVTPAIYETIWNQEIERIQIEEFYEPLYTQN